MPKKIMQRRTYLKTLLAAGAAAGVAPAQKGAGKGIMLTVDMSVDPAKEKEMLHNFHTIFKPAAEKTPGYIDVNVYKLRSAVQGSAPAGLNYIFVLRMESEELRQKCVLHVLAGHRGSEQQPAQPLGACFRADRGRHQGRWLQMQFWHRHSFTYRRVGLLYRER